MKALPVLADREPAIVLPAARAEAVDNRPRLLAAGVPEADAVPGHLALIRDLAVTVVAGRAERAVWNTLITREHPHGLTTLCRLSDPLSDRLGARLAGCGGIFGSGAALCGAKPLDGVERR